MTRSFRPKPDQCFVKASFWDSRWIRAGNFPANLNGPSRLLAVTKHSPEAQAREWGRCGAHTSPKRKRGSGVVAALTLARSASEGVGSFRCATRTPSLARWASVRKSPLRGANRHTSPKRKRGSGVVAALTLARSASEGVGSFRRATRTPSLARWASVRKSSLRDANRHRIRRWILLPRPRAIGDNARR